MFILLSALPASVVGVAGSLPLCLPALPWKGVADELSDGSQSICSSVLQTHVASGLSAPMIGIKARNLLLLCLKNSLPVLFCSTQAWILDAVFLS